MNLNRVVPYLSRINSCEGTREKAQLLYITKGGKENFLIFHFKENGKFYQYCAKCVYKTSILLMCNFTYIQKMHGQMTVWHLLLSCQILKCHLLGRLQSIKLTKIRSFIVYAYNS
jgi:hypothetical protein